MKTEIPMNNSTHITIDLVYEDENINLTRYNIVEDETGDIVAASWMEKNKKGDIIKHHFHKPEWLIRHEKLTQILPSVVN
jgi:hypothetical protein